MTYSDYIWDVVAYFSESDYIVTSRSSYGAELKEEFMHRYEISKEDWTNLINTDVRGFYILDQGTYKNMLIYIAPLRSGSPSERRGCIIIFPEEKYLAQKIRVDSLENNRTVFLMKQESFICLTNSQDPLENDLYFGDQDKNRNNEIRSVLDSNTSNLKYMIVDQYYMIYWEIRIMRWMAMIGIGVSVVLGIWSILYFSRKNYIPMKKLISAMSGKVGAQKQYGVNEYIYLQNVMTKAIDSQEKAEKYLSLLKLLRGHPIPENIKEQIFVSDVYVVVAFAIEDIREFFLGETLISDSYRLLSFVVSNCVKDFFSDAEMVFDLIDMDHYLVQIIGFSGKTEKEQKETIWKNLKRLHEFFNSSLKIKLSVSIGSLFSESDSLNDSYEQAREAMEYRMMMGNNVIIDSNSLKEFSLSYRYSIEHERDIINSLKNGNFEQSRSLIFQVIDSNISSGMMSAQLARCMFFDMISTIIKGLSLIRLDNNFLGRLNPVERLLQCGTFEMMKSELSDILSQVCDYININKEDPSKRQFERVVAYIEEYYMDEGLNVASLTERTFISKSFLIKLFKDNLGVTPLDYINRLRCEHALELLKHQEYTIEEISQKVGCSNVHTFIRIFKKAYGETPGAYRMARVHGETKKDKSLEEK